MKSPNSTNNPEKAPIEIILYHMVNFMPSPLKNTINYSIFREQKRFFDDNCTSKWLSLF